jgi:hypothetical protein
MLSTSFVIWGFQLYFPFERTRQALSSIYFIRESLMPIGAAREKYVRKIDDIQHAADQYFPLIYTPGPQHKKTYIQKRKSC